MEKTPKYRLLTLKNFHGIYLPQNDFFFLTVAYCLKEKLPKHWKNDLSETKLMLKENFQYNLNFNSTNMIYLLKA